MPRPSIPTQNSVANPKTPIGSPQWHAELLTYYATALLRALLTSGEEYRIERHERKLVTNDGIECTVCHRPLCDVAGHARRTRYSLLTGIAGPFAAPTERHKLYWFWMRDSLLWGIEEFQAGRPLYAFRALVQASGYAGKLEGLGQAPHDTLSSDAFSSLKNAVESVIGTKEGF